jgi:hypothetical protein
LTQDPSDGLIKDDIEDEKQDEEIGDLDNQGAIYIEHGSLIPLIWFYFFFIRKKALLGWDVQGGLHCGITPGWMWHEGSK